ncbi:MAG: hybrid sensor histidine kinase/response regulator, partial [Deltaproteobacteria bacterium]|nr:hybrid sensor histidine kinase/response regulator [Deltaproteobacteria bacterium]
LKYACDPNKNRDRFEQILKAGHRARDLVKQILTFSRQQEQERVPVNLKTIIKEALKLLEATLPKNITIQRQMHAGRDLVLADPTQIHQILMNLCTNAAQSMREQGGILTVSLSTCHCDAAASKKTVDVPPGSYLKLSVTDTGSGISKDVMQRIFDPYFTTKKKGEGTGLGLSVVHGIAKSHGGT